MSTPEENLSDAIAQQEEDRLKALAKREKLERRRQPYTSYYGTDGATGQVRVKPQGAEGVLNVQGLSNVQPYMGEYGRGFRVGADFGNVRKPEIEIFGKKTGEVCVLASVVRNGLLEFWLGGDRALVKIATLPTTAVVTHVSLELIGPGKNDWIVALRYGPHPATIVMLFGQHTEDEPKNWLMTNVFLTYFTYRGMGFWNYGPISALADDRNPSVLVPGADAITLGSQLQLVQTGYHHGIEGLSTIAGEYYETSSLPFPPFLEAVNSNTYTGLRQFPANPPIPFTFTGENSGGTIRTAKAEFQGDCFGPGYLGPGGAGTDPATPPIFGNEALPKKLRSEVTRTFQSFSSEFVSWALYERAIVPSVGMALMNGSSEQTQILPSGNGVKTRSYRGGPTSFVSGWLWTISYIDGTDWPALPGSVNTIDGGLTISKNNAFFVAPGIAKNYILSANSSYTTTQGVATWNHIEAGVNFEGGFFWSSIDRSGPATLDAFRAEIFSWNAGSTYDPKTYLNWKGQDIRASGMGAGLGRTWQGAEPYPKSNSVTVPQEILSEPGIKRVDITPYEGAIVSGVLEYAEGTKFKAKVLSMSAIGSTGQVWMAKHWQR